MNYIEKTGLIIIIVYLTSNFPELWKGAEVIIGMFGSILFLGGTHIQEWIDAFQEV